MPAKSLLSLFLILPLAAADPPAIATTGLTAEDALKRMQVPEGFAVDLIAAEPQVAQPIAMCFDARGRLWVAEGMTYPQRAPEGQGKDRILIFEDTDGDGTFDSRKIFARNLNLVSGMEVGFGGVYVGAAPYLLFIPDADGDDKPDSPPQVILDGFGYQDTHETLNSFIWGPDGCLWGCHGVFTNSRVGVPGTPDSARVPINAGVWRFHPQTKRFEVVSHGTSNPWGLDFNDWGDAFIEACVIPHLWHMIPGGHYQRQAGADFNPAIYDPIPTIADHQHWTGNIAEHAHWGHEGGISSAVSDAGGGHAHSGFAICLSDSFPAEFRNDALFFNIHGHRMNHDKLERNGSGWTGRHGKDLLLTYDQWFLGVSIRPGPDGALYFNDWYDATSCHRTDPLRWDRDNGRIYRLRHGEQKPWTENLNTWSDDRLAQSQAGRNEWEIRMARKVLQERVAAGKPIAQEARDILYRTLKEHSDETRQLRALWTLRACGLLTSADITALLDSKSEHLRAWAVRIAAEENDEKAALLFPDMAGTDRSPVVQLALCSAMQRLPEPLAMSMAASLSPRISPEDPNLLCMLWFGMERGVPAAPEKAITTALMAPNEKLLLWVARRLNPDQALDALFTALQTPAGHPDWLLKAITTRLELKPEEKLSPAHAAILAALDTGTDTLARDLAARAGDPSATGRLWITALDPKAEVPARKSAIKVLASLPTADESRWRLLLADPALQLEALEARPVMLSLPEAETAISGLPLDQKATILRLAIRENRIPEMIRWLKTGRLRTPEVPADVVARLREVKDEAQQQEVVSLFGEVKTGSAERQASIAEWHRKLTPETLAKADPKAGRLLFDRTCAACHRLFGEGGQVGPELTGGDRGNISHWLDNILDPNALIGPGYELHQLTKKDGSTVTGMLAGENDQEFILKTVGVETRVARKEISENKALGISMMPEGLLTGLSDADVADLIRYLSSPGQVEK